MLLGRAAADLQGLRDLKAEARITYQQADQKNSGTAVILFKNPDLLKLEPFGLNLRLENQFLQQ